LDARKEENQPFQGIRDSSGAEEEGVGGVEDWRSERETAR
jgi:hypothetical protein